ncbi:MAG TPA: hypothetical protein PLS23_06090, partial [Phycisphaerae bacterium]|nr:hypothetical protein [Phycisphaerae bacterium]
IFSGSPLFWRTDWVLEAYIAQITRHYNLNKEQEEYTRKLLNQRVKSFLQQHERDVRALMAEYMDYQLSQELPEPNAAREFARKAAPLAKSIREEIFQGNMEWREILNDEQRAKHDQDLQQMTTFFDNLELGLERWKEGRVQPSDLPGRIGPRPTSLQNPEDAWEFWVKNFIRVYKLDEGQQQTAMSVLRELKDEAARYRQSNKDRFSELEAAQKTIRERAPKTDPEGLAKYQAETARITKQKAELERPITALFDQLRSRVEAIPTVDQRKARQAQLDRLRASTRRPATQPQVEVRTTTRPETSPADEEQAEQVGSSQDEQAGAAAGADNP